MMIFDKMECITIGYVLLFTTVATRKLSFTESLMPVSSFASRPRPSALYLQDAPETSWSETDDWSRLSIEEDRAMFDSSDSVFNQDIAAKAAEAFEEWTDSSQRESTYASMDDTKQDDRWIIEQLDEIHSPHYGSFEEDSTLWLYDTNFDEPDMKESPSNKNDQNDDSSSQEIAMFVRCNESPEDMLVAEGRAVAPLTEEDRHAVEQLVTIAGKDEVEATEFLREAVSTIFRHHARPDPSDKVLCLQIKQVANWMTQALKTESKVPVSAHDKRVLKTMSAFSSFGSGRLVEADFQRLYLTALTRDKSPNQSWESHWQQSPEGAKAVWRDLENHGIQSPIEQERDRLQQSLKGVSSHAFTSSNTLMDECELIEWDYTTNIATTTDRHSASNKQSSHQKVERVHGTDTPLYMKDGDFIFIDEESCIGCRQCVNVSPDSFFLLDNGRARTFDQRRSPEVQQAVASCPVACMHSVTFKELEEYETARDSGDGRDDHRHLGQKAHIPLHVAGMDSDANRRSSWYHTLRERCINSSQCPQKGCFNCPRYSKPGENPYFQQQQKKDNHIRAQHFIDQGDVDALRKAADL